VLRLQELRNSLAAGARSAVEDALGAVALASRNPAAAAARVRAAAALAYDDVDAAAALDEIADALETEPAFFTP